MMKKHLFWILIFLFILFAGHGYLARDLWFDEALTVQNFALLDSLSTIYANYVIPNNQLIYTMMLHLWIQIDPGIFAMDDWMRLLTLLLGIGTLAALWSFFKVPLGRYNLLIPLAAFALSPVFLLHATALRGYMAAALGTVLALKTALLYTESGKLRFALLYLASCIWTFGILPSNLMAIAGVILYALPCCGEAFYRNKRFYILIGIPLLAFVLFYGPIFHHLLQVIKVGSNESWDDSFGVLVAVAAALLGTFAMLLLPVAAGAAGTFFRPRFNMLRTSRAAIWLLPIGTLILPKMPFPRVFFPLFPLFLLLTAAAFRDISLRQIRLFRRYHAGCWYGGFFSIVLLWSFVLQQTPVKMALSRRCGDAGRDDFFYSRCLRPQFQPRITADKAKKHPASSAGNFYMSFAADPWALMFYLRTGEGRVSALLFDGPGGIVERLPEETTVILAVDESIEALQTRFPGVWRKLFVNGEHQVWSYRN